MSDEIHPSDFGTPFAALVQHFESNDIRFSHDRSGKWVQFFMTGDCAVYNCRFQITHNDDVLQARVIFPVTARDPKMRPLVIETLARANNGMALGSFDIEVDSGQISFHLGQVIPGGALEDKLIGGLFLTCMATSDRYFPALMRVMFGGSTPNDAVYLSELDVHAEAVESGSASSTPAKSKPRSPARKPSSRRRSSRNKSAKEFPDLFEGPASNNKDSDGTGPSADVSAPD
ncbi:MAG: hypothetical protein ACKPBV_17285 [Sphaerospermopsis kisseleviana]